MVVIVTFALKNPQRRKLELLKSGVGTSHILTLGHSHILTWQQGKKAGEGTHHENPLRM